MKAVSDTTNAVANNTIQFGADNASKTDTQALNKQGGIAFNITGGADKNKLSDNNIGVNANGSTVEVKLAKELKGLTSAEFASADGKSTTKVEGGKVTTTDGTITTVTGPNGITIKPSNGTGTSVSLTNAGLDNGGNKITNVAEGTDGTDAVNVNQLKSATNNIVNTGMKYGANLGVDGKPNVVSNKLGSTLNIVGTANVAADDNYDGNNVVTTVKQTDDGNTTVTVKLNKDLTSKSLSTTTITVKGEDGKDGKPGKDAEITVGEKGEKGEAGNPGKPGKNGSDGKIGVNGKDGSAVVINGKDGSIGLNGKDGANGLTIKGDKGANGVDGTNGVNGKDGMTRIVYETIHKDPTDPTKDTVKTHEVATMDDGMKYAGDDGQTDATKVIAKKLNQTVDIIGGADKAKLTDNNIGVNNVGGKLKVQLTSELTNINSITNGTGAGKVEFNANGETTFSSGTTGDKVVTINGKEGTITTGNATVATDGFTVKDGNDKTTVTKAGTAVTDGTNTTSVGATTIRVNGTDGTGGAVTDGIVIGKQTVTPTNDGKAAPAGTKGTEGNFITGLGNTTWDVTNPKFVSGRAATEDQLLAVSKQFTGGRQFVADTVKDGKDLVATVGLGETLAIKGGAKKLTENNIGVELAEAVKNDDGTIKTPATMTVKLAKDVKMGDGSTDYTGTFKPTVDGKPVVDKTTGKPVELPITVKHDGNGSAYTIQDGKASVTTVVKPFGMYIQTKNADGKATPSVSLTADGLDNGGNRILNVAPGINGTDGVNVDQLKGTANNILNQATGEAYKAGAKAAALAALKPLQYDPLEPTQIMAGIGNYRNETAAAIGLAHYTQEATMFHVGVTLGEHQNMINAGVTHKFGWSPEEKAIPERYKAGPISSVYVMQDEVSALKEENERTKVAYEQVLVDNANMKAENQEMKESYKKMAQDNEEMKAQIKMLMQAMGMK